MGDRTCSELDCARPTKGLGLCAKHYARVRYARTHPPRERGPIGYFPMHRRLDRLRGFAKTHACAYCGDQAREWSYDNSDPEPLFDVRGYEYSLDPDRYIPLCHKCHARRDGDIRAHGSRNGRAKFTEDQVRTIRARIKAGEVQMDLVREYGVTKNTIHWIVTGKMWKRVS